MMRPNPVQLHRADYDALMMFRAYSDGSKTMQQLAVEHGTSIQNCPSSNGLGQSEVFGDGGSGSLGLEFRRLSTDVAIVAV
jgi:hypothetical protein